MRTATPQEAMRDLPRVYIKRALARVDRLRALAAGGACPDDVIDSTMFSVLIYDRVRAAMDAVAPDVAHLAAVIAVQEFAFDVGLHRFHGGQTIELIVDF